MAKRKINKALVWTLGILTFLILGLISFSFYNVMNRGVSDALMNFLGVQGFYITHLIIIVAAFIILLLIGIPSIKIFNKMIRRH